MGMVKEIKFKIVKKRDNDSSNVDRIPKKKIKYGIVRKKSNGKDDNSNIIYKKSNGKDDAKGDGPALVVKKNNIKNVMVDGSLDNLLNCKIVNDNAGKLVDNSKVNRDGKVNGHNKGTFKAFDPESGWLKTGSNKYSYKKTTKSRWKKYIKLHEQLLNTKISQIYWTNTKTKRNGKVIDLVKESESSNLDELVVILKRRGLNGKLQVFKLNKNIRRYGINPKLSKGFIWRHQQYYYMSISAISKSLYGNSISCFYWYGALYMVKEAENKQLCNIIPLSRCMWCQGKYHVNGIHACGIGCLNCVIVKTGVYWTSIPVSMISNVKCVVKHDNIYIVCWILNEALCWTLVKHYNGSVNVIDMSILYSSVLDDDGDCSVICDGELADRLVKYVKLYKYGNLKTNYVVKFSDKLVHKWEYVTVNHPVYGPVYNSNEVDVNGEFLLLKLHFSTKIKEELGTLKNIVHALNKMYWLKYAADLKKDALDKLGIKNVSNFFDVDCDVQLLSTLPGSSRFDVSWDEFSKCFWTKVQYNKCYYMKIFLGWKHQDRDSDYYTKNKKELPPNERVNYVRKGSRWPRLFEITKVCWNMNDFGLEYLVFWMSSVYGDDDGLAVQINTIDHAFGQHVDCCAYDRLISIVQVSKKKKLHWGLHGSSCNKAPHFCNDLVVGNGLVMNGMSSTKYNHGIVQYDVGQISMVVRTLKEFYVKKVKAFRKYYVIS